MPLPNGQPTMMEALLAGERVRMSVGNRDVCFGDPVKSVVDGTHHTSRQRYNEHLKANGCVEIGNDSGYGKPKKREIQGDFNVRKELAEATREVLSK